jgi:hypothetical protein
LEIVESDQKGISVKDLRRDREDSQPTYNQGAPAQAIQNQGSSKINDKIIVPGEAVGMIIGKGVFFIT